MRTYIIGNDGITLCREPPTAVNAGEIAVASNEELHAAARQPVRIAARPSPGSLGAAGACRGSEIPRLD